MKTDTEIKVDGTQALIEALGEVDAERYITLLMHEPFDYTKWQRTLLETESIEQISAKATQARAKPA